MPVDAWWGYQGCNAMNQFQWCKHQFIHFPAFFIRYIVEKIIATKQKNYVQPTLMTSNLSQPLIQATG